MHSRKILLPVRHTTRGNDYGRERCTEQCGGQPFPAGTGGTLLLPTRKDLQVGCSVGCPLSIFHTVLDKGMARDETDARQPLSVPVVLDAHYSSAGRWQGNIC